MKSLSSIMEIRSSNTDEIKNLYNNNYANLTVCSLWCRSYFIDGGEALRYRQRIKSFESDAPYSPQTHRSIRSASFHTISLCCLMSMINVEDMTPWNFRRRCILASESLIFCRIYWCRICSQQRLHLLLLFIIRRWYLISPYYPFRFSSAYILLLVRIAADLLR